MFRHTLLRRQTRLSLLLSYCFRWLRHGVADTTFCWSVSSLLRLSSASRDLGVCTLPPLRDILPQTLVSSWIVFRAQTVIEGLFSFCLVALGLHPSTSTRFRNVRQQAALSNLEFLLLADLQLTWRCVRGVCRCQLPILEIWHLDASREARTNWSSCWYGDETRKGRLYLLYTILPTKGV